MYGDFVCVCLSVCPVQFVFTELQSGSNLLLGVPSKPKSCENSVDPTRGVRSESKKTIAACLGKLSQNPKCRCDAESGASLSHRSDGSCC